MTVRRFTVVIFRSNKKNLIYYTKLMLPYSNQSVLKITIHTTIYRITNKDIKKKGLTISVPL